MVLDREPEALLAFTLLGPPGSGKGTQSRMIQERLGYQHISTGDLCRESIARGGREADLLEDIMRRGELIPDDMMIELLTVKLRAIMEGPTPPKGVILDGFPRNTPQAQRLGQLNCIEHFHYLGLVYISVPDEVVEERLLKRAHEKGQNRDDDRFSIIRERIRVFHQKTLPLVDYMKSHHHVARIDGLGDTEAVFNRLAPEIRRWEENLNHQAENA